jgi:asparagine synthase (glutamine-hydrolysing)
MSAIVGVFDPRQTPLNPQVLVDMLGTLTHRGTDARGTWTRHNVGLGHGMFWTTPESLGEHQPLCSQGEILSLVCDARIDNRDELIAALTAPRHPVSETTDADLILAAYMEWGEECPIRLIGDFAFAIWDDRRQAFFCARDPMGVKSLYYCCKDGGFALASEIKALFTLPWVRRELNEERVAEHLVSLVDDQESTFYREISRLPAGHCMSFNAGAATVRRYWALDARRELVLGSDGEYEEAFRELFAESVRCRLRSAFPVGTTLSGGLDSSSIACVARRDLRNGLQGPLHAFSAVFPGLPEPMLRSIDERRYAQAVVAEGDIVAHELRADELNPIGDLQKILWHQDDPLVPFNIYLHLAMFRAARDQGVRVMLDGFDGDTTVSHGYQRLAELAKRFRWISLLKEARAVCRKAPNRNVSLTRVLKTHAVSPLVSVAFQYFPNARGGTYRLPWGSESLIDKSFARRVRLRDRIRRLEAERPRPSSDAREVHRQGLESPLIAYSLELVDKTAAACSIEARYPFFDRRLVEFCLALPADQKLRGGWGRSILRRAMNGILPPQVQWRNSKASLSPNFYRNLRILGKDALEQILSEDLDLVESYVDVAALRALYTAYSARPSNADAMTLFLAVSFAAWMRQNAFVDGGSRS